VKAAVENDRSGEEVMRLLLDRRGKDVYVTKEIMRAAARNIFRSGAGVMEVLVNRLGEGGEAAAMAAIAEEWNEGDDTS
jgi:hypothetical protein